MTVFESWLTTSSSCNNELRRVRLQRGKSWVGFGVTCLTMWSCSHVGKFITAFSPPDIDWFVCRWFGGGVGCCFFSFSNLSKNFPRKLDRGPALALPVLQSWIPGLTSWLLLLCMNIWGQICLAPVSSAWICLALVSSAWLLETRCSTERALSSGTLLILLRRGVLAWICWDTWSDNGIQTCALAYLLPGNYHTFTSKLQA